MGPHEDKIFYWSMKIHSFSLHIMVYNTTRANLKKVSKKEQWLDFLLVIPISKYFVGTYNIDYVCGNKFITK